jgi:hypothetical protein
MTRWNTRYLIALILTCSVSSSLLAAGSAIGLAVSSGTFMVNRINVAGSATLFDGSSIQTGPQTSRLDLQGSWMQLGSNSEATVSNKRITLQRGMGELGGQVYDVEARTLRISPGNSQAVARVRLESDNKVLVAAVRGPVLVHNNSGLLVMNVAAGRTFLFAPQAGAADSADVNGCLLFKAGKFIVVDQNGQIAEVTGADVARNSGNPVHLTGRISTVESTVPGASRVITIQTVEQTGEGGCLAAAQQADASLRPPGAPATPGGTAPQAAKSSHAAIYAGVAAAAVVGAVVGIVAGKGKSTTSPQ